MSKASLLSISVALGIAAGSLGLTMPASALQLTKVQDDPYAPTPSDWTSLNWKVEGRAGADPSIGTQDDYEIAIGPNGAQADKVAQQEWLWENDVDVDWSLNWDGSKVTFKFGNLDSIFYTPTLTGTSNIFNGFYLLTKSQTLSSPKDPNTFVDPGTTIDLKLAKVNGEDVSEQSSATSPVSGQDLSKILFSSDEAITSMAGTVKMSWNGRNPQKGNGRSYVDFQIKGFNIDGGEVSVPEPTSTLGLLAIGAFGVGSILKRQRKVN